MSWNSDKYFSKAQIYWQRASSPERDSEQFLMNVAFTCEFIVRGALCTINPALNAAPDKESILFAAGLEHANSHKTVNITEAIDRLSRFIPEIKDVSKKIVALIEARNKELHSDEVGMTHIESKELMPSIYLFIVNTAKFANQDINVLLGKKDALQATKTAEAIVKDRKKRTKNLIEIAKERFFSLDEETKKGKKEEAKIGFSSAVLKNGQHIKSFKCPSCSSQGLLVGVPVGFSEPILKDSEIIREIRVIPSMFECKCCELKISGLDEVISAGFPHEFCTIDNIDPIEHFDIDPMDYVDLDEVAREYDRSLYEYQDE
jgi:hypothetical protein